MRQIHYAGEDLLTGSDIADALLAYAQALAAHGASDTVEIPVAGADGAVVSSSFLIGPASQLVAVDAPEYVGEEIYDESAVSRLVQLAENLNHPGNAGPIDDDAPNRADDFS